MKYKVAKTGLVALSPAVVVNKIKGETVNILDEDHAQVLLGAGQANQ